MYIYEFIAHASLDMIEDKLSKSNTFFSNIDRFNEWIVSAFVTPSSLKFIVLHDVKNDDGIKGFCQEIHETYVKVI
jgi:trafficking protein particle complex subunit 2